MAALRCAALRCALALTFAVHSGAALATPSETACTALNNEGGNTSTCDHAFVPLAFDTPYTGGLTIDFQQGDCESDLQVDLSVNEVTVNDDDWLLHGTCTYSSSTVEFCCILEDDDVGAPEVLAIGIRGLDTADHLQLTSLASTPAYRDAGMHSPLSLYVYGEGGSDTIYSALSPPSTNEAVITLRGGDDNDKIYGYEGDETIYGDGGSDWLDGGPGTDVIYGGAAYDRIIGGLGGDMLHGGDGTDVVCGDTMLSCAPAGGGTCSDANDPASWVLTCDTAGSTTGHERDTIWLEGAGLVGSGAWGQGGGDRIYASTGNGSGTEDNVYGGPGDDELVGDGWDILWGEGDSDHICADATYNVLAGGAGNDNIMYAPATPNSATASSGTGDLCLPTGGVGCDGTATACPFTP